MLQDFVFVFWLCVECDIGFAYNRDRLADHVIKKYIKTFWVHIGFAFDRGRLSLVA